MTNATKWEEMLAGDLLLCTGSEADGRLLVMLAGIPVDIREKPSTGLVMMSVTDACGEDFHLGEALVTEARAFYEGHTGYAMVTGNRPEKALIRASLSAVTKSGAYLLLEPVYNFLIEQMHLIREQKKKEQAMIASTKVQFEKMNLW